jgi:hypothetical protein
MPETLTQDDELLTPEALAEVIPHGNVRNLERWRMLGTGPAFVRLGRRVYYRRSAVSAWLDRQTRQHTAQDRRAKNKTPARAEAR